MLLVGNPLVMLRLKTDEAWDELLILQKTPMQTNIHMDKFLKNDKFIVKIFYSAYPGITFPEKRTVSMKLNYPIVSNMQFTKANFWFIRETLPVDHFK